MQQLTATSPAPLPIDLEPAGAWKYEHEMRELSRIGADGICSYIWKLFIAIITCQIFCEGLPEWSSQRKITHEVVERFICTNSGVYTRMEGAKIIRYLLEPMLPNSYASAIRPLPVAIRDNFQITGRRVVENWTEHSCSDIFINAEGEEANHIDIRSRDVGSTLLDEEEFTLPTVEGVCRRQMSTDDGEFVLDNNPRIAQRQLQAGFHWMGKPDQSERLLAAMNGLPLTGRWILKFFTKSGTRYARIEATIDKNKLNKDGEPTLNQRLLDNNNKSIAASMIVLNTLTYYIM